MNKIGFVAEVLPQSRFILVLHDLKHMMGAMKRGFSECGVNNEDYPPYVHYWPDCEFPCWSVLRNDRIRVLFSKHTWRRNLVRIARKVGLKKVQNAPANISPPKHALLSEFQIDHPDLTRYYPGEGFRRLPEAWLKMNGNALRQLDELDPVSWKVICFQDLLDHPAETLLNVSEFLKWPISNIEPALTSINPGLARSFAAPLTEIELSTIQMVVNEHRDIFERIMQCMNR